MQTPSPPYRFLWLKRPLNLISPYVSVSWLKCKYSRNHLKYKEKLLKKVLIFFNAEVHKSSSIINVCMVYFMDTSSNSVTRCIVGVGRYNVFCVGGWRHGLGHWRGWVGLLLSVIRSTWLYPPALLMLRWIAGMGIV